MEKQMLFLGSIKAVMPLDLPLTYCRFSDTADMLRTSETVITILGGYRQ